MSLNSRFCLSICDYLLDFDSQLCPNLRHRFTILILRGKSVLITHKYPSIRIFSTFFGIQKRSRERRHIDFHLFGCLVTKIYYFHIFIFFVCYNIKIKMVLIINLRWRLWSTIMNNFLNFLSTSSINLRNFRIFFILSTWKISCAAIIG